MLIVFCWAAAAETSFAVFYGIAFPWYRSEFGRQMLAFSASTAAIMDLAVLSMWWRPPAWVFLAGYTVFAATLTWRLAILGRMWWQQHRVPPS